MASGPLCQEEIFVPAAFGEDWRRVEASTVMGVRISDQADSSTVITHRQQTAILGVEKARKQWRARVPYAAKISWWARVPQASYLHGTQCVHVSKALLLQTKRWETKQLVKILPISPHDCHSPAAYRRKIAHVINSTCENAGKDRLVVAMLKTILRSYKQQHTLLRALRQCRGKAWRQCVMQEPYKRRKLDGVMQTRQGRRMGVDDVFYDVLGPNWFDIVEKNVMTKQGLERTLVQVMEHLGLIVNGRRPPHIFTAMSKQLAQPIGDFTMPILHNDDKCWAQEFLQIEFITDNQTLAEILAGNAASLEQDISVIFGYHERFISEAFRTKFDLLPFVSWRKREFNKLTDAMCDWALNDDARVFGKPTLHVNEPKLKAIQIHSDGAWRSVNNAAISFSIILFYNDHHKYGYRKLLYATAQKINGIKNSFTAEMLALRWATSVVAEMFAKHGFVNW